MGLGYMPNPMVVLVTIEKYIQGGSLQSPLLNKIASAFGAMICLRFSGAISCTPEVDRIMTRSFILEVLSHDVKYCWGPGSKSLECCFFGRDSALYSSLRTSCMYLLGKVIHFKQSITIFSLILQLFCWSVCSGNGSIECYACDFTSSRGCSVVVYSSCKISILALFGERALRLTGT